MLPILRYLKLKHRTPKLNFVSQLKNIVLSQFKKLNLLIKTSSNDSLSDLIVRYLHDWLLKSVYSLGKVQLVILDLEYGDFVCVSYK